MIRFALIAASTLGFFLTAALGNLMVPLLRAFQGRWDEPKARQAPSPKQEAPDAEPERPPQAPTMGGLCLMVGVLAAVGVGWTAACVAQPELLGAESLFSVRLLTALLGALLFGGVGLLDDLARRGGIAVFLGDVEQIHTGIFPVVLHLRVVHAHKVRLKVLRHHHLAAGRFRLRSRRGRPVDVLAQHAPQREQNEDGQQDRDARQQRF